MHETMAHAWPGRPPIDSAWQSAKGPPSPLMLCDRLLTLAQDADRAGLAGTAADLLRLAHGVFDEGAPRLAA